MIILVRRRHRRFWIAGTYRNQGEKCQTMSVFRRCFFCGNVLLFVFVFAMLPCLFFQPCGHLLVRADLLALLYVIFFVFLSLYHWVS